MLKWLVNAKLIYKESFILFLLSRYSGHKAFRSYRTLSLWTLWMEGKLPRWVPSKSFLSWLWFPFLIFRVRRRWLLQRQTRSCHRDIRRKGFHLRWRVQFSCKSHCKVRCRCNEKGLQYVCNSEWWLVCGKFYCATNLWQIWKIYELYDRRWRWTLG